MLLILKEIVEADSIAQSSLYGLQNTSTMLQSTGSSVVHF